MKLVKESLNEGRFSCKIEDLNKAVRNYVKTKLSSFGNKVSVTDDNEHILVTYTYDITNNIEYLNMNDEEILNRIKRSALQFKNHFLHFENFCTSGLRGVADTFRSSAPIVNINYSYQLDKLKYKTNKDNWRAGERKVYRYSKEGINELNDEKTYIERYGRDNLNILTVNIGIFLRNA